MISLPQKPKIVEKKENFAVFEIEELAPGYGITVGSALRRVLFSSLEGAAITSIKMKGASHEFSIIPNIVEDMVEITLNFKQIRFKYFTEDFPQKAELKVRGQKKVTAGDIKVPSSLEIVNPKQYIATISDKKGEIDMEILIGKGIGYETVEQRKKERFEIGTIPLDAIFAPIRKVNFRVENMRVGDRTDFNRLFIEVETDGTITPEEAFLKAVEVLVNHFQVLQELPSPKKEERISAAEKKERGGSKEDLLKIKTEEIGFSKRTTNALVAGGIKTLGSLVRKTEKDLFRLDGFGDKAIKEVKRFLGRKDLSLKE